MDPLMRELFETYECENEHEFITDVQPKGYNVSAITIPIDEKR